MSCHLGKERKWNPRWAASCTTSCYMNCCQCCGSEAESLLLHPSEETRTKCVLWFCDHLVACLSWNGPPPTQMYLETFAISWTKFVVPSSTFWLLPLSQQENLHISNVYQNPTLIKVQFKRHHEESILRLSPALLKWSSSPLSHFSWPLSFLAL